MRRYYIFFIVLAVVSALTIVGNLALRRAPVHDAKAVSDIQALQSAVDQYFLGHNTLPADLGAARPSGDVTKRLGDYTYRPIGPNTYQLCTTFMKAHQSNNRSYPASPYPAGSTPPDPDTHIKGYECFDYVVIPIQQPYLPK